MREILKLIRIRTIVFAVLTMYAMRYWVVLPMLELMVLLYKWPIGLFHC